ncbi:MAG: DUF1289 domain-containing protein [Aestuariivirgaceae bacterium]
MNIDTTEKIESPCVKICVVDPQSGYCIGCGRTREEIAGWLAMSPPQRSDVIEALPDRIANLTRRRTRKGGATARRSRGL